LEEERVMKISIFGLGYVGSVSLGCLAANGHEVIGVDISQAKVDFVSAGRSPIVEPGLDEVIQEQRAAGRVSATTDLVTAVRGSEISFICVGTPPTPRGHLDLDGIFRVGRDIGAAIGGKDAFHIVAIRSTVLPGTNRRLAEIIETASHKKEGRDFAVVSNPEFLREGTAIRDYRHPPYTLVGSTSPGAVELLREVYGDLDAPFIPTDIGVAELIKYVNNTFHALKISFANEVGNICKELGVDSHRLMEVFCQDTKLNISPYYLKPGFSYGGSCLPKDLKALCTIAHDSYLKCPVLESIEPSNEYQKNRALEKILQLDRRRVGFLGLSFKAGTDDLRGSPIIDIAEKLIGKGFEIKIYDQNVRLSRLVGANKEFILQRIPLISQYICENPDEVVTGSDLIVVVNNDPAFRAILDRLPVDKYVYDLVNIPYRGRTEGRAYEGIAW
jgi:GDP-mannose 6-dehydrogenase